MKALLDSFIQEISQIDDAAELRRRLVALKSEEIELRNRESEYLRSQEEAALLYRQLQDEAKGLRRENTEMKKKLEKLEAKGKLDTNRLFGRKTEKIDDLLDGHDAAAAPEDPLSEDAVPDDEPKGPAPEEGHEKAAPGRTAARRHGGKRRAGKRAEDLGRLPQRTVYEYDPDELDRTYGKGTGASSAGTGPRKKK